MILRRPVPRALLVLGVPLLVAAVVLGILVARAGAGEDDRAAAVAAARAHLVALGTEGADPAALAGAVDGATGPWRDRLAATGATGAGTGVVRAVGLEALDGDTARVLAAGLVGGGASARAYRVEVSLVRADDRWLVADVVER